MREFTNLVYLDLQKTGTTSIVQLLRDTVREPEVPHGGHSTPEAGHDTAKFHFISVRNPVNIYISLFGHGVAERGGMFRGLRKRGLAAELYDPNIAGFNKWLEFMLDPANLEVIGKKYANNKLSGLAGPLSQRLLILSIVDPFTALNAREFKDREDLTGFFHENRLYDHYVRTEHMVADLFALWPTITARAKVRRKFRELGSVEELNAIMPRKNVGDKIPGITLDAIPQELKDRVRDQEWVFYDIFGYGEHPKGAPPPLPPRVEAAATAAA